MKVSRFLYISWDFRLVRLAERAGDCRYGTHSSEQCQFSPPYPSRRSEMCELCENFDQFLKKTKKVCERLKHQKVLGHRGWRQNRTALAADVLYVHIVRLCFYEEVLVRPRNFTRSPKFQRKQTAKRNSFQSTRGACTGALTGGFLSYSAKI